MPSDKAKRKLKSVSGKGTTHGALSKLQVIDKLIVGPPRIEPDRIRSTYTVVRKGVEASLDLSYRYEEPVFRNGEDADANLAAMITAQVALNYGLFCKEIQFRGFFEEPDKKFLLDMAANTAREIYVNKFLAPNPFLEDSVSHLPATKLSSYLQADLHFDYEGKSVDEEAPEKPWKVDPDRYTVLSSGGKDSLLSYGVLNELGCEVHPVFVNESGRHWFTSLNAFRHFQKNVPNTTRVWTDSDRLFAWMLRHLPFVRGDFLKVRSDEYPVRLWTVAVFIFGSLPLLRKREVGRLVIGDEYDTTERMSFNGITHYNALYDQSLYFDHALSRYFLRKGWGVTQFSLLRPLSELLIQKVLVERYPDLLALQVSCHAAHVEGERVFPCGKCEKCRRIAGMLAAFGADPAICGYGPDKMERILALLVEKGVHQERPASEQLGDLLYQKKLIAQPRLGSSSARSHSEVLKLRFHPNRSPIDEIPLALRKDALALFLEHADGAVRRFNRRWEEFHPLKDATLSEPYLFDRPEPAKTASAERSSYLWSELTWPEIQNQLRHVDVALLPVGAIEQHGRHLPLDTDAFDADYLARAVAEGCTDPKPLVLPPIPYGVSYHHEDFAGALSLTNDTLAQLIYEIGMSAARNGIKKLLIINGHGGNGPTLNHSAQMINRDAHIFTCVDTGETSDTDVDNLSETPNDVHAGEIETSTTLAVRPHLVKMDLAKRFVPRFSSEYLDFSSKRSVGWYARTSKISPTGVLGDPTKASAEKGRKIWEIMIGRLVEFVEHLKRLSLAEIYQKRY